MYNNSQDFDVILKCGDRQIHAHRVILRMWSPFFNRAFTSQFSVAQSPVFVIDPDDDSDYEPLCAILKHVYGIPLKHYRENGVCDHKNSQHYLDYGIKIRDLAACAQYDLPLVTCANSRMLRNDPNTVPSLHTAFCDLSMLHLSAGASPHLPIEVSGLGDPRAVHLDLCRYGVRGLSHDYQVAPSAKSLGARCN